MDDVLAKTANGHAGAWKQLFDNYFQQHDVLAGKPSVPFDIDADYARYLDCNSRCAGVRAFLKSRGIQLPIGTPDDGPEVLSQNAFGKLEGRYFLQHLKERGVDLLRRIGPVGAKAPHA
ncbi:hypothetical protein [Caballeronia sordidicola]|uniref:hypothetical protein n=1 Tax=Caballeronia sordidicola TaxID=196367 RepID=UPI0015C65FF9|nr:hypothetical protein [Caballeronia sordidicola]